MLEISITYLLIGLVAGFMVGLVGSGSSLVILPLLCLIFPHIFPQQYAIKLAVGTTLASLLATTITAAISQRKYVTINGKICAMLAVTYVVGAAVGAYLAHYMPAHWLHFYIGVLLAIIAVKNLFFSSKVHTQKPIPPSWQIILMAFGASILVSMAGVASGLLMIPYLSRFLPYRVAVATSIASAVAYACGGMLAYVWLGWSVTSEIHLAWGYVFLPAFILISIAIIPGTNFGLKLAYHLKVEGVRKIFYVFLIIAAIYIGVFL